MERKECVRNMKPFFFLLKINYRSGALAGRSNSRHVFQDPRDFLKLWDP